MPCRFSLSLYYKLTSVDREVHATAGREAGATVSSAKLLDDLIGLQIEDGFEDDSGLGEDGVFQDGLVGDEGVHGSDAADGGV